MDLDSKKEDIKLKICDYLKQGMFKKDASKISGISEDTYLRWYKDDADFADRVEASILEYKRSLIQSVTIASVTNPKIALEILRTRWSGEWSPKYHHDEDRKDKIREGMDKLVETLEKIQNEEPLSELSQVTTQVV